MIYKIKTNKPLLSDPNQENKNGKPAQINKFPSITRNEKNTHIIPTSDSDPRMFLT